MAESPLLEEQRENWGSRAGFVLAAIGSAVGLGNLWGFPYKVYTYGGGAFLIPYIIAMLVVGIPLLILEFSLGHMTQRAAPDAYRGINRKSEPLGWWGILLGFVIITYYPVILAYCAHFLGVCGLSVVTGDPLPWAGKGLEGVQNASNYFRFVFLDRWADGSWAFGSMVWKIVGCLVAVWVLMYLCIFRGVKLVSKVVLWTVPLPWLMLAILALRGMTLPGAQEGLNFYLSPDWSKLADPETWRWGFGQMFFSMSLAFGVMITYASFLHRKSDINNNAVIIGLADIGTSFVAGLAVFATLGGMAYATQFAAAQQADPSLAVPVSKVATDGPGLAFVAFPYALAQLPGAAWFGVVFFLALILLGIDSAFSITESVLASLVDKTGWNRNRTLIGMSVVGLAAGLVYCTRGGLVWLGSVDDFVNSTYGGITLIGLLEFVVLGWSYRLGRLREHANERSDWRLGVWWEWLIRYVAPVVLGCLFVWSLIGRVSSAGGFLFDKNGVLQVPVLAALCIAAAAPVLALMLSLVKSPGANVHAAHRGQPRTGRAAGMLGVLLVLVALAAVGFGAYWAYRCSVQSHSVGALIAAADGKAEALTRLEIAGDGPIGLAKLGGAAGAAAAFVALLIGASVVRRGERGEMRPSAFGRWSAGMGVLLVGAAAGIGLSATLAGKTYHAAFEQVRISAAQPAAPAASAAGTIAAEPAATEPAIASAPAPAPVAAPEPEELEGMSYVVLAIMIAIICGGLGWCFYRAVKAAAAQSDVEEQTAEEM